MKFISDDTKRTVRYKIEWNDLKELIKDHLHKRFPLLEKDNVEIEIKQGTSGSPLYSIAAWDCSIKVTRELDKPKPVDIEQ